jgi:catechol 2,3-dioxygenase-like lactoylglutathione lyase family enzyme
VSLITLGVADLDRARRFYEALGWTSPSVPDDGVVFFQCGAATFWGGLLGRLRRPRRSSLGGCAQCLLARWAGWGVTI